MAITYLPEVRRIHAHLSYAFCLNVLARLALCTSIQLAMWHLRLEHTELAESRMEEASSTRVSSISCGSDLSAVWDIHFYRQRLRALQGVDEIVEGVIKRLEDHGILDSTYVIFSSDNGYHIGQHRLQPGKECGYEEDINIPLIIRGPGVPKNSTT